MSLAHTFSGSHPTVVPGLAASNALDQGAYDVSEKDRRQKPAVEIGGE